jgi:hypothetical protein
MEEKNGRCEKVRQQAKFEPNADKRNASTPEQSSAPKAETKKKTASASDRVCYVCLVPGGKQRFCASRNTPISMLGNAGAYNCTPE